MKQWMMIWALLGCTPAFAFEFPQVTDHWLREAPPNARMLAAYAKVTNTSTETLTLTGAFAPDFGMVEIHKTIEVDGVLRMREQPALALPADGEISMQPGGLHIMLMMPERSFKVGDEARICLIYADKDGNEHVQHLDFPVLKK
ncbi:copper chaperone PCu(A)C [Marinicella sediminis]|uniref:Copper chaperone PCu(A)C n=1 Tax=Marinicella sediminis TaxID=1792834 RepID=A0ABV7JC09_9GAMM|nr:copper chaperone PCu(A)C [Marinicella sediminis]